MYAEQCQRSLQIQPQISARVVLARSQFRHSDGNKSCSDLRPTSTYQTLHLCFRNVAILHTSTSFSSLKCRRSYLYTSVCFVSAFHAVLSVKFAELGQGTNAYSKPWISCMRVQSSSSLRRKCEVDTTLALSSCICTLNWPSVQLGPLHSLWVCDV